MWAALKEAAEAEHTITGILNPNSGPSVVGNALADYTYVLNDFLNKGEGLVGIEGLTVRKNTRAEASVDGV